MSEIFSRVLAARRSYFNARFAEKTATLPNLDGAEFFGILRDLVAPVVESISQLNADAALGVGQSLYDLALDLFAQGLLGYESREPILTRTWRELLPQLAPLLAQQPQRVAASVMNALYNIVQTPGARPEQWMEIVRTSALLCDDADTFLRAGQVAAWRAGMAHYRLSALPILATLPPPLARAVMGLGANESQPDTQSLHYALMANPWYTPTTDNRPETTGKQIQIVKRAGAFRGFGGLFLAPPRVMWTQNGFVAQDGEDDWLLFADAFGATFHRIEKTSAANSSSPFKLNSQGRVSYEKLSATFPELASATSSAANQNTLAVTTDLTHAIYLVAVI